MIQNYYYYNPSCHSSERTTCYRKLQQQESPQIPHPNEGILPHSRSGRYNRKLFWLMASYWFFASMFLSLPFFLFKKPIYCEFVQGGTFNCCDEGDEQCVNQICTQFGSQIIKHVKPEESLTYIFQLFCDKDWIRVMYKIFPQTLSFVGFLLYGLIADKKGRKVAIKISWRLYTVGIVLYSMSQAEFLKMFGYIISSIHCFPSLIFQFVLFFEHNIKKQNNRRSLLILPFLSAGPLILSLLSELIVDVDNRVMLGLFCAVPAFVLTLLDKWVYESAVCTYRFDKAKAFGIINVVARENKMLPIIIDLSKSFWHRNIHSKTGLFSLLRRSPINVKMLLGFFFLFIISFNIKISQISLDQYTSTEYRSIIVNIPTALADICLCLFLLKFKFRTCRIMNVVIILLLISMLACGEENFTEETMSVLTIVHAVFIRYLSELCDGLLLIWAIESFPTICRAYCVGFVFCGVGLGVGAAYLLRDFIEVAYILGLVCTTFALVFEGFLELDKFGIMTDTLHGGYYDENDTYYKM